MKVNSLNPIEAQKILRDEMKRLQCDVLWVTSFDAFLSEYTPKVECHRSLLTGFSGSVAEAVIDQHHLYLFVDGRYHEQADRECLQHQVSVVKVEYGTSIEDALEKHLLSYPLDQTIGIESQRTPWHVFERLQKQRPILKIDENQWGHALGYQNLEATEPIKELALEYAGVSRLEKWKQIPNQKALFVSKLDTLSWFLNARSLHRPFQMTIKGLALVTKHSALVMTSPETPWDSTWSKHHEIVQVSVDLNNHHALCAVMTEFLEQQKIQTIQVSQSSLTVFQHDLLASISTLEYLIMPSWEFHYKKNKQELDGFRQSFLKASKAIAQSLSRSAKSLSSSKTLSEWDIREDLEQEYKRCGASSLSFRTIAGVGENGSVIHYGSSSKDRIVQASELVLVDSGAYFEAGIATDTTRTFLSFHQALPWQKEIYTAVLKGLIQLSMSKFAIGTPGGELDEITRAPIKAKGYNYAHGTGHGVGILVHEGGYKIAPNSTVPIVPDTVGSLEPGIYLPGKGGVRLENIAIVRECADQKGFAEFETLTFVGFDHRLIFKDELTPDESAWLDRYEKRCLELGTSFNS